MNTQESTKFGTSDENSLAGKYLTFCLGDEEYGIEILRVREIIGLMDVTPVPRSPAHIRGVINLRGRIIPVLDLRRKFGMEPFQPSEESCIIVLDVTFDGVLAHMGVLVDGVCEVLDIAGDDIDPPPPLGAELGNQYLLGMAKAKDGVKILLNAERILHANEVLPVGEPNSSITN